MSEYMSWQELKEIFRMRDFEIAEFILQKNGVQPYTQTGIEIPCPMEHHWGYLQKKAEYDALQYKESMLRGLKLKHKVPNESLKAIKKEDKNRILKSLESRPYYELYRAIKSLEIKGIPHDKNEKPYKFEHPCPPECMPLKKPNKIIFYYIYDFQINMLESFMRELEKEHSKVQKQLDSIYEDLKEVKKKASWTNFILPKDDALRSELINNLEQALFRCKDIAAVKKNRKDNFSSKDIIFGDKILREIELIYDAMKLENSKDGFDNRSESGEERKRFALNVINDYPKDCSILYKNKNCLQSECFITKDGKPWKIKARILQNVILAVMGEKVNYEKFYNAVLQYRK